MSLSGNAITLLQAGLRAEELRQKAIASNIANMETPGYRRVDVRFSKSLAKALDSAGQVKEGALEPEIYQTDDPAMKANGNNVSMEAEVGDMIHNSLRYTTYVRLLRQKYAQIESAISERV